MSVPQELLESLDILARIHQGATALAAVAKELEDKISVDMTQADVNEVKSVLEGIRTRLGLPCVPPPDPAEETKHEAAHPAHPAHGHKKKS